MSGGLSIDGDLLDPALFTKTVIARRVQKIINRTLGWRTILQHNRLSHPRLTGEPEMVLKPENQSGDLTGQQSSH
jgi:hypothetical protein